MPSYESHEFPGNAQRKVGGCIEISIIEAGFFCLDQPKADLGNKALSSWKSKEDVERRVQEFCDAATDDPDIKIISVKYSQKKEHGSITYSAVLTCHVSKVDDDFVRINGKVFQQKNNLLNLNK